MHASYIGDQYPRISNHEACPHSKCRFFQFSLLRMLYTVSYMISGMFGSGISVPCLVKESDNQPHIKIILVYTAGQITIVEESSDQEARFTIYLNYKTHANHTSVPICKTPKPIPMQHQECTCPSQCTT